MAYISVLDYLDETAIKYSDKIVYEDEHNSITFSELKNKATRLGSALSKHTSVNKPIIVLGDKTIDIPVMYLGILYAGCYYAPIGNDVPEYRMNVIMETVHPEIILTDRANQKLAESFEGNHAILVYEDLLETQVDEDELGIRRRTIVDTDPAYIIFTSGSTGKPKGVVASHRALVDYIEAFVEAFDIDDTEKMGNQAPLEYIAAIRDIYIPLKTGASMVIIPKVYYSFVGKLFDFINEKEITTLCWVVSAFALCHDMKAFSHTALDTVRKVFFTGSVMPARKLRYWQENLPNAMFVNHYGPTEITASCTYYIVDHLVEPDESLPIGVPFKNTGIILLTEDGKIANKGEKGEICVKGSCLALGYYENREKTEEVFINNPTNIIFDEKIYKTGDIGSIGEDNLLHFHGRIDFQIKHMGHRVELSEIETQAKAMEEMEDCVCLYNNEKQQIWMFYVGKELDRKAISHYLKQRLPNFMVPRKVMQLEALPKNFNGKIDLQKLKELMN